MPLLLKGSETKISYFKLFVTELLLLKIIFGSKYLTVGKLFDFLCLSS
jgi:hypothetical protein